MTHANIAKIRDELTALVTRLDSQPDLPNITVLVKYLKQLTLIVLTQYDMLDALLLKAKSDHEALMDAIAQTIEIKFAAEQRKQRDREQAQTIYNKRSGL